MKRCSIALCPWKAKYQFTSDKYGGYYECWFHGEDGVIQSLWNIFLWPFTYFYRWMKYDVCLGWHGSVQWRLFKDVINFAKRKVII